MFFEDKTSRDLAVEGDESLVLRVTEYKNSSGISRNLKVNSKDSARGLTYELGTTLIRQKTLTMAKNEEVRVLRGLAIPDALRSYFKPVYRGIGEVVTETSKKYIKVFKAEDKIGLVLERGLFLACETKTSLNGRTRGFAVETSWNTLLESGVENYRDLTSTVIKGNGYYVLESPVPFDDFIEITVLSGTFIEVNEDNVMMRTTGVVRRAIPKEERGVYTSYSGNTGKGVLYEGVDNGGKIWIYPSKIEVEEDNTLDLVKSFIPKPISKEDDQNPETKGVGMLGRLGTRR